MLNYFAHVNFNSKDTKICQNACENLLSCNMNTAAKSFVYVIVLTPVMPVLTQGICVNTMQGKWGGRGLVEM